MAQWNAGHPAPRVTLSQVADHIDHIAQVAGHDHVGLGADYDGVGNALPEGLEGVDTYPALLAELMRRGWSDADIAKLAGAICCESWAKRKGGGGLKKRPASDGDPGAARQPGSAALNGGGGGRFLISG